MALKITLFKCVQSLMLVHLLLELIASNSLINFPFLFLPSKSVTQLHLNVIINLNVKFGDRVKAS